MFFLTWPEMHGALTHFPVALIMTALAFQILGFRWPEGKRISLWVLAAAVVMAMPTLLSGWIAGNDMFGAVPSPPSVFIWHRAAAFTTSGVALLWLAWRLMSRDHSAGKFVAVSLLLALGAGGAASVTGYLGGQMVFSSQLAKQVANNNPEVTRPISPTASVKPASLSPKMIAEGRKLYFAQNCQGCHKLQGTGGTVGPDLTHAGKDQPDVDWQIEHLKNPQKFRPNSIMPAFAQLKPDQLKALAEFLVAQK